MQSVLSHHATHDAISPRTQCNTQWNQSSHTMEWVLSSSWGTRCHASSHMYESVMSLSTNESYHIHVRMYMRVSATSKESHAMSHVWMSHVTCTNESRHIYEWVSVVDMTWVKYWLRLVTYLNEACHTYKWGVSHILMSHVTYANESCHRHDSWLLRVCDVTRSYMSHASWIMTHGSFVYVIWLIRVCDMAFISVEDMNACLLSPLVSPIS